MLAVNGRGERVNWGVGVAANAAPAVSVAPVLNTGVKVAVGVGDGVNVGVSDGVGVGSVGVGGSGVKVSDGVQVGNGVSVIGTKMIKSVGGGSGFSGVRGLAISRIVIEATRIVSSRNSAVNTSAQP